MESRWQSQGRKPFNVGDRRQLRKDRRRRHRLPAASRVRDHRQSRRRRGAPRGRLRRTQRNDRRVAIDVQRRSGFVRRRTDVVAAAARTQTPAKRIHHSRRFTRAAIRKTRSRCPRRVRSRRRSSRASPSAAGRPSPIPRWFATPGGSTLRKPHPRSSTNAWAGRSHSLRRRATSRPSAWNRASQATTTASRSCRSFRSSAPTKTITGRPMQLPP